MLNWCIDEIEGILASPQEEVGWTRRWLEVKKKVCFGKMHSEVPEFGFADPQSYAVMKAAVRRLRGNGAVRHGPECFNYAFPQELDDKYLVISETLPGQVPWKYVDSDELIGILCDKVDEGFTFPLNPKWILCDEGWKRVYDKLVVSTSPHVQDSIAIWYPPMVQDRIADIASKYPCGFGKTNPTTGSNGVSVDLAEHELRQYKTYRDGRDKLKMALKRVGSPNANLFSATLQLLQAAKKEKSENSNTDQTPSQLYGSLYDKTSKPSQIDDSSLTCTSDGTNSVTIDSLQSMSPRLRRRGSIASLLPKQMRKVVYRRFNSTSGLNEDKE